MNPAQINFKKGEKVIVQQEKRDGSGFIVAAGKFDSFIYGDKCIVNLSKYAKVIVPAIFVFKGVFQ